MDWKSCIKDKFVKSINVDNHLISSLINSSSKKLKSQNLLELNEDTSSSKVTLTYDALRELLEAISISKGYKIYNHECYSCFLKEILNESYLGDKFDNFRRIRNDINYYGKEIKPEETAPLIKDMIKLIESIKLKFLK